MIYDSILDTIGNTPIVQAEPDRAAARRRCT